MYVHNLEELNVRIQQVGPLHQQIAVEVADGDIEDFSIIDTSLDGRESPALQQTESGSVSPIIRVYLDGDTFFNVRSSSLLDGIDTCFKLMIMFNISFPPEVKHIWSFFQRHFYKVLLENAFPYDRVFNLIKQINDVQHEPIEVVEIENAPV